LSLGGGDTKEADTEGGFEGAIWVHDLKYFAH